MKCSYFSDCRVFVLDSVNILRKYWFILDIPLCFLLSRYRYVFENLNSQNIEMIFDISQYFYERTINSITSEEISL